jgi:hypothetical protein
VLDNLREASLKTPGMSGFPVRARRSDRTFLPKVLVDTEHVGT